MIISITSTNNGENKPKELKNTNKVKGKPITGAYEAISNLKSMRTTFSKKKKKKPQFNTKNEDSRLSEYFYAASTPGRKIF